MKLLTISKEGMIKKVIEIQDIQKVKGSDRFWISKIEKVLKYDNFNEDLLRHVGFR